MTMNTDDDGDRQGEMMMSIDRSIYRGVKNVDMGCGVMSHTDTAWRDDSTMQSKISEGRLIFIFPHLFLDHVNRLFHRSQNCHSSALLSIIIFLFVVISSFCSSAYHRSSLSHCYDMTTMIMMSTMLMTLFARLFIQQSWSWSRKQRGLANISWQWVHVLAASYAMTNEGWEATSAARWWANMWLNTAVWRTTCCIYVCMLMFYHHRYAWSYCIRSTIILFRSCDSRYLPIAG